MLYFYKRQKYIFSQYEKEKENRILYNPIFPLFLYICPRLFLKKYHNPLINQI